MRNVLLASLFISVGSACASGGGESGASGPGPTASSAVPPCTEVCSALTKSCGATPPQCESTCQGFSDSTKECVVRASSCQAMNDCGSTAPTTGAPSSSGTSGTTDPCKACGAKQFCVTASSNTSEVGCVDAPATCNGSSTSLCPCLSAPGTGPCTQGAKSCSEGLANRITCK